MFSTSTSNGGNMIKRAVNDIPKDYLIEEKEVKLLPVLSSNLKLESRGEKEEMRRPCARPMAQKLLLQRAQDN